MSMVAQSTIEDEPRAAYVGLIADMSPIRVKSGVSASHKTVSIAVTAVPLTDYTVTINGTVFTFRSGGGALATTANITAGLRDAINAGSEPVTATGADTPLVVTSRVPGAAGDFTLTTGANLVATTTASQGPALPYGYFVCMDPDTAYDRAVKLPAAAEDVTGGRGLGVVCTDNYTHVGDEIPTESVPGWSMANILEVGRVWVEVDTAVKKGDDVSVRFDSAGNGPGSFTKGAGAVVPRATYDGDSRTIGGKLLAIVKLNR